VTEISSSQDLIGAEVFAEPFSYICIMGSKFVDEESGKQLDEKKVMKFIGRFLVILKKKF